MWMVVRGRAWCSHRRGGGAWLLRCMDGGLPVLPGVLVEHLPTEALPLRAPFRRQPALGHGHFKEPELGLEVLLAVALGRAGPEEIGRVAEHAGRQVVHRSLPGGELVFV